MSIYHCSIKIISRADGRSAVASAAYRSGEKLHNEETGLTHDFTKKAGVTYTEIMLPKNAPEKYKDREVLWNDVQREEKRSDAQFAREIEVAFPVEMTNEEKVKCVKDYIKKNFVDEGMIADFSIHDKGDGNPHAHIMLTMRSFDEEKHWEKKQKTVFANARDEMGRAIFNPDLPSYNPKEKDKTAQYKIPVLDENGEQKVRVRKGKGRELLWEKITIPMNDWNDHNKAEVWRKAWADECNKYLEEDKKIDHRSYKRQGLDMEPTIHEGVIARQMEAEGKVADRCEMNREIRERNKLRDQIKELAKDITDYITEKARDIYERIRKLKGRIVDIGEARRNDGAAGNATGRNRNSDSREPIAERRIGRNAEHQRAVSEAEQQIAETDRRIEEIKKQIEDKEKEQYDRYNKIIERRRASDRAGTGSGSERRKSENNRTITNRELESFIAELNAYERITEENGYDSFEKHADGKDRFGSEGNRQEDRSRNERTEIRSGRSPEQVEEREREEKSRGHSR